MSKPAISLFTQPHARGRRGGKWSDFFHSMKMEEIKLLPDELQEKQSVQAYVPTAIRHEFVFRTNPEDGKRYVARLPEDRQPPRPNRKPRQTAQEAAAGPKQAEAVSKATDAKSKPSAASQKVERMAPPKQYDAE